MICSEQIEKWNNKFKIEANGKTSSTKENRKKNWMKISQEALVLLLKCFSLLERFFFLFFFLLLYTLLLKLLFMILYA